MRQNYFSFQSLCSGISNEPDFFIIFFFPLLPSLGLFLRLQCESSLINSSCSAVQCDGPENLSLGNSSSSGCNHTTCTYAGYNRQEILTAINVQSTCAGRFQYCHRWFFLRIYCFEINLMHLKTLILYFQVAVTNPKIVTLATAYNNSSAISLQGLRWNFLRIFIHILLICLPFLK